MFKNLDGECFGIFGRQNEVIEFALSNGYAGISVNFSDLVSRTTASGVDFATRYLVSAKKLLVGTGSFNIRLAGTEEQFRHDLGLLSTIDQIIDGIEKVDGAPANRVQRMTVRLQPYSDTLAYHENFEQHRSRISELAEKLVPRGLKLGIGIQASESKRQNKTYSFIHNAEGLLTLVNAIGMDNVGIDLNTWDWRVGDGGLDQLSELPIEKVIAVTLTDTPDGADLSTIANTQRLMPGSGDTTFNTKVCKWLFEAGYTGPLTPGPSSSQFSGSSRDAVIHKASNAIDAILVAVGAIEPLVPEIPEVKSEESEADGDATSSEKTDETSDEKSTEKATS